MLSLSSGPFLTAQLQVLISDRTVKERCSHHYLGRIWIKDRRTRYGPVWVPILLTHIIVAQLLLRVSLLGYIFLSSLPVHDNDDDSLRAHCGFCRVFVQVLR